MLPVIRPGDLIAVQRRDPRDLQPGEVVIFQHDDRPIRLHPSIGQRLIAMLLRHSYVFTRICLRLGPGIRKLGAGDAPFGTANLIRF
jgi:hypothetical protein